MSKHITVIQGHPDSHETHFGHALAKAYAEAAQSAGHEVRQVVIGRLDFPLLRSKEDWETQPCPATLEESQQAILWADHLVILYPLWLGAMPALLKAFLEQVFRPKFAATKSEPGMPWTKLLKGKSARVVVTMGMPALVYRWFFRAHSLKALERNILAFVGIKPIRSTVIGMIESPGNHKHEKWLERMRALGSAAR